MKLSRIALAMIACAVVGLCFGCTANRAFRTDYTPCDPALAGTNGPKAVIEVRPEYKLGFVEFDDQGWFWNTNQLEAVKKMVRSETGLDGSNSPQGIVMVLFVHGWKNNAAPDNDNVEMFRQTLTNLNITEAAHSNRPPRKIVGVYAGWRGLSASMEPFEELSFWERKNTAHKVGGYGAMTELLVELEKLQQTNNSLLPAGAPTTEYIIVGHSFGGGAVYSAISEIVTERFVDTVKYGTVLKPLGDQVILLNPAFEAARHYNLNQMAVSLAQYPTNQRPVLAIFTSKGDWATHYAFPIGRFFSTMFEKNRDGEQSSANRDAVGWFKPFVTHDLYYNTNAQAMAAASTTYNTNTSRHEFRNRDQWHDTISKVRELRRQWQPNNTNAVTYYFTDTILKPRHGYRPGDPVLVVSVDTHIMKDHDDIGNQVLINFLEEYVLFCRADSPTNSP
jgi:hypothetical protein